MSSAIKKAPRFNPQSAARSVARKLALQALYRWQLNASPWQDLMQEFANAEDMPKADAGYFRGIVSAVGEATAQLDELLAQWADRSPASFDPIERAVLWIGVYELRQNLAIPYRVVISEAVSLTRRFGATDGHKFVNAVLDRAARELRAAELP